MRSTIRAYAWPSNQQGKAEMLNILMPMSGPNKFDSEEFAYPKPLIEVAGRPLIEHVIRSFERVDEKRFIFVVNKEDCDQYHLDDVLRLVTQDNMECVRLEQMTRGAACSALMAIESIDSPTQLLISNSDHVFEFDLNGILGQFAAREADAGVVCFDSVHPKWSFVRLDEQGRITETAEKRPLSRHAIAGLYYFRQGADFVRAAMRSIEKDASVNGMYYIAPVLNELVLEGLKLEAISVSGDEYHNFYSPHKLREYESYLLGNEPKHRLT